MTLTIEPEPVPLAPDADGVARVAATRVRLSNSLTSTPSSGTTCDGARRSGVCAPG
jgi:hypothetical protein